MVLMAFCLLVAFSLDSAAKCDDYVVGTVWIHKGNGDDEREYYEGCKKGCFWNNSYTEMGVRKCEKCEDITDEITCTNNDATCRWKGGKCKPQSCPQIANTRNTGAFVLNNADVAASKGRERLLKECVEGSELEKKYNDQYWSDYEANANKQWIVNNPADSCTFDRDQGCPQLRESTEGANRTLCSSYEGCTFGALSSGDPAAVAAGGDVCRRVCSITPGLDNTANENACRAITGCAYYNGRCVSSCERNIYSKTECESTPSTPGNKCVFVGGSCLTGCHAKFTPGTDGRKRCEELHCMYDGDDWKEDPYRSGQCRGIYDGSVSAGVPSRSVCVRGNAEWYTSGHCEDSGCESYESCVSNYGCSSQWVTAGYCSNGLTNDQWDCIRNNREWVVSSSSVYPGDGTNLKSGGVFTDCNLWETEPLKCGINSTLDIGRYSDRCDDRLYGAPSRECRTLFHITRQKCKYDIDKLKSYEVFETDKLGGNLKPGTRYEKCVQDERLRADEYKTVGMPLIVEGEEDDERHANLTEDDREILFGFRTPGDYCKHLIDLDLADCEAQEEARVQNCYSPSEDLALDYTRLFRDHVGTKAASAACREIYGCMYAKDNERCSAWAVWALVLTIVLVVVVVVAALAVVGVFVLLKVLKSSKA